MPRCSPARGGERGGRCARYRRHRGLDRGLDRRCRRAGAGVRVRRHRHRPDRHHGRRHGRGRHGRLRAHRHPGQQRRPGGRFRPRVVHGHRRGGPGFGDARQYPRRVLVCQSRGAAHAGGRLRQDRQRLVRRRLQGDAPDAALCQLQGRQLQGRGDRADPSAGPRDRRSRHPRELHRARPDHERGGRRQRQVRRQQGDQPRRRRRDASGGSPNAAAPTIGTAALSARPSPGGCRPPAPASPA